MFSSWLKNQLTKRGYSASDLAERSGVSNAEISRLLSGQREPSLKTIQAIAEALSVSVYDMLEKAGIIDEKTHQEIAEQEETIQIPLCGDLPRNISVEQCREEKTDSSASMPMTRRFCESRNCMAFIVRDDSLSALHIHNKDILIIDRDLSLQNGDAVVVCLDDVVQVRGYYKKDGDIIFTPFSSNNEPVIVSTKGKNWHVIGKVVHAVKHFTRKTTEESGGENKPHHSVKG